MTFCSLHLVAVGSVTRWLDYFSIFVHLQQWKWAHQRAKFTKAVWCRKVVQISVTSVMWRARYKTCCKNFILILRLAETVRLIPRVLSVINIILFSLSKWLRKVNHSPFSRIWYFSRLECENCFHHFLSKGRKRRKFKIRFSWIRETFEQNCVRQNLLSWICAIVGRQSGVDAAKPFGRTHLDR